MDVFPRETHVNIYIQKTDLPNANITDDARLYAGKGWLALVREALKSIGAAQITAIREDSGLLRIELANASDSARSAVKLIQLKSANVCEICGAPGSLRHELKGGKPAGWHRTRCADHIDTRTSSWEMPRISQEPSTADLSRCMTAGQLIEMLAKHSADTPVLVEGYETGFDEIHKIEAIEAAVNPDSEEWDGQYQPADKGTDCLLILGRRDSRRNVDAIANAMRNHVTNATDWETAPAVGLEYGADWLRDDLAVREKARREALWARSSTTIQTAKQEAAGAMLARIHDLDKDFPIGPASSWTVEEVKARVIPSSERHIRSEDIPEPWAARFLIASIGSTICAAGHPLEDWQNFLYLWEKENEQ